MKITLFLSPHNDDAVLFGSFTIQRESPLVLTVFDSCKQLNNTETRRKEDANAMKILGAELCFLGLSDVDPDVSQIEGLLRKYFGKAELIYAPAIEDGGHPHHNIVGLAASRAFQNVRHYMTYTRRGKSIGSPVPFTPDMALKKLQALSCYESRITWITSFGSSMSTLLRKVFLQTQFGSPHPWTERYFANFQGLARYGWELKVFTPNEWKSSGNIEIVPMTLSEFDALVESRCGVNPKNWIQPNGAPKKFVSDYYPAYGHIFQKYIAGADYWGFTNWDCVYGRLDRFIPDSFLDACDIWSDDVETINGIFTLMRNTERINNLFREVPGWERCFTDHAPQAFDEHRFTEAMRKAKAEGRIRWGYPQYGGLHSYDRLAQHQPRPRLRVAPDGALIELNNDIAGAAAQHYSAEKTPGREIMMFHFNYTKQWPLTA